MIYKLCCEENAMESNYNNTEYIEEQTQNVQLIQDVQYAFYMSKLLAIVWNKLNNKLNMDELIAVLEEEVEPQTEEYEEYCGLVEGNNTAKSRLKDKYSETNDEMFDFAIETEEYLKQKFKNSIDCDIDFRFSTTNMDFQYMLEYENTIKTANDLLEFGLMITENLESHINTIEKEWNDEFFSKEDGFKDKMLEETYMYKYLLIFADNTYFSEEDFDDSPQCQA